MTVTFTVKDGGGNVNGIIDALNVMLDLAIPQAKQEEGTTIVPGHGRLCGGGRVARTSSAVSDTPRWAQTATSRSVREAWHVLSIRPPSRDVCTPRAPAPYPPGAQDEAGGTTTIMVSRTRSVPSLA